MAANWLKSVVLVAMVAALAGCLDDSITGTRPLSMQVEVTPATAAVAEDVLATYATTGTGIFRVIVAWGDGLADTVEYSGTAVEASQSVVHQYAAPGTFLVIGAVTARNGVLSDSVSVVIN